MQLRTFSSLGLALLLVVVVVGVACAQEVADVRGIMIRVDKPAADAWVKIDDRIDIRILAYDGLLDGGFRLSVVDATLDDDDVGITAGGSAAADGFVYYNIYVPNPGNLPGEVEFGNGESSGVDTFRVSITVSPQGTPFESKNSRAVKVVVDLDAATAGNELNNLMTNRKISPASAGFGASRVGDGVRFGIDANRPIHANAFKSFSVETESLSFDTTRTGLIQRVRFRRGDKITVRLGLNTASLLNAGAYGIRVGIVETDSAFSTAPVSFAFSGDRLYSANLRDSKKVEEGDFADNRRVRVEAWLVDAAGNLGGASIGAPTASVVSAPQGLPDVFDPDGVEWIADATSPGITIVYPHPARMENRISAAATQTLSGYIPLPGEARDVQASRRLNPLEFNLSEVPDSIRVTHGDSTHRFGSGAIDDVTTPDVDEDRAPTGNDSTATLSLPWKYARAGGVRKDLKIEVWDSLGNTSSMDLTGIWYDEKAPVIGNLFPSDATAPIDAANHNAPTINLASKDPVFTIDEELDSLSVRYIETGSGATVIEQSFRRGNPRLETTGERVNWPVDKTGFFERNRYDLQILAIDLAGNASVTDGGTLTFTRGFLNPNADMFKVTAMPDRKDAVVAGRDFSIRIAVLDTMLTRIEETDVRAVTYHAPSSLVAIVSGDQAAALNGVGFSGTGVSDAPSFALPAPLAAAGMVARASILDADGWHAGQRDVAFRSTRPLTDVIIMVAEGTLDPATGAYMLRISGQLADKVNVEVAEFSQFVVTAIEGQISAGNVAGAFSVWVVPTDAHGNPSLKITNTTGADTEASVAVTFSSSNAAVTVPSGQQMITGTGGATFGAVAANVTGNATITVRTVAGDWVTGSGEDAVTGALTGSVSVNIVSDDGPGPGPGAPAAPANIVVRDYMGADGKGDQGGLVMINFPYSAQHDAVVAYQIHREINKTARLDEEGNVIELEAAVKEWVPWASISFGADDLGGNVKGGMQNAVIPALDNVSTNWGVVSVGKAGAADMTAAGKRVFTDDELMAQFNASEDDVKSLIGDRKKRIFVPVNPDVSVLMGSASVPGNIRTEHAAGNLLVSARTVTEAPVAAVDNIAPAAVTGASGDGAGGVVLRWTPSADDRVVSYIPFTIYNYEDSNIPIPGVKGYTVMRGAAADDLEEIATLPPGSKQFKDDNVPDGATSLVYRIDAYDDNNVAMSDLITVDNISLRVTFVDANGDPVYLVKLPSQGGNLEVDFEDFVAFAAALNSHKGDANYNPQADVNDDGTVDFHDFVAVAGSFGRTAAVPAGSKLAIAPQRPGVNADTEMTLDLAGEKVRVGEEISVTVSMANAKELNGFGLELTYDADKFEFVSAVPAAADLLKSQGDETPLFRNWPEEGRISVVNAIINAGSVSGEGALVTFTFKVLREFEDNARFQIAQGVVFDADQLQNPVVSLGALDVQSTPTEFALHQNYPNPFNPQTNIPYDLAESGDVVLRIYNLLGQEVRTLVRERRQAGRYTVQWSGTDDRGVSVSSGIYFYQVSVAGQFQDARRLMLLK